MWECGLKHVLRPTAEKAFASLLMWECGLKLMRQVKLSKNCKVTPYVGVWIETPTVQELKNLSESLLMWECGLKQYYITSAR